MSKKTVRIGCASAFYGDSQLSARQLVDKGDIDYLVFDYLAESTMAILARMAMKNDKLGYAIDFVSVAMKDVLADCAKKGIKVVANAGGVNVPGCIEAIEKLCEDEGLNLIIAGVYGDDLMDRAGELAASGLSDIKTGEALPDKLASINAYLGADPIAKALDAGADVVVTGRVVDSAVVLAPLLHEFGWKMTDYNQLAQGSLAGHVVECGAQCTGGNFTDWHLVPDFSDMSYPIAEVSADGGFIIDIPPGTGGMVTPATVGEQILYEIGDPANYLLPDVACDFSNIKIEKIAKDRVQVTGAKGRAPGYDYKVCATYIDGHRMMGTFYMAGLNCADKARTNMQAWVKRTRKVFEEKGLGDYRAVSLDCVGCEDIYGPHARAGETREVMGKFGLHHDSKAALTFAAAEMAYLGTSAAPGMTGFGAGRARPQPLMRIHSSMLAKSTLAVKVQLGDKVLSDEVYDVAEQSKPFEKSEMLFDALEVEDDWIDVPLVQIAYARSGDKGDSANIGVMAREERFLPILHTQVTAPVVAKYFAHLVDGAVTRYSLPGFNAYNFLMEDALGGGATASLRLDSQGKTYGQMLLSLMVRIPPDWV